MNRRARTVAATLAASWALLAPAVVARPPAPASVTFGTDVRVTYDNPGESHREEFAAADPLDPLHFLAGCIDEKTSYLYSKDGAWVTFDGGQSWSGGNILGPLPAPAGAIVYPAGDPTGDFDALGHTYFGCTGNTYGGNCAGGTSFHPVYILPSADGGMTWGMPVAVDLGGIAGGFYYSPDKPWIAADRSTTGPYAGRLYYTYMTYKSDASCVTNLGVTIQLKLSTDFGQTWVAANGGAPIPQPLPATPANLFPYVAGIYGTVYVAYTESTASGARLWITRSTDGGATFAPQASPTSAPLSMTGLLDNGFQWYPVDALGHAFRHGQFPQIAVSPQSPSTVYMTWNHADPGNPAWDTTYVANCCNGASTPRTFNAGDIAFARSTDGGQTWTAPKRLDDDPPLNAKDQWFPALTVSGNGTIHASWYDRRDDPANVLFHVYHTSSTDGGLTWTPNVRVSDVPSDPAHLLYGGQAANLGDYGGMAANDQRVVCVWLDARTGTPAGELRMYADTGAIGTSCGTIVLAPATLPVGTQGTPYGATLTASGGSAPYTFAVTSGSLPAGLSLSAAGVISGTPSAAGSSGVTITATDAAGCTGSHPYTITINPAGCGTIAIAPASLPSGTVGVPYSQQLTASGGTAPYGYAVTSGALPAGLTLSASGLVSGTPSAGGASSFVVEATDAAGCKGTKPYTITIGRIVDDLTGQGLGPPNPSRVRVFTGSGAATTVDFLAYAASQWGVNVAASAVSPGTYDEILTAPGPGPVYGPQVRGFQRDGTALAKLNYYAYGTLKYGANVAAADVDGDTLAEILTGAGPGAVFGPHVRGWNFDGGPLAAIAKISFFAYGTLKFGVNVSGGALDADVYDEILTGPGPGVIFGPQVRGFNFDGASVAAMAKVNFNAFATPQYGASVSGGDVDADGYAEIAAAPGPGPTLPSRFAGFDYDGVAITNLPGYDVTPFATFHGGRLGIGDVTPPGADGRAELLASPGRDATAASTVATYAYNGAALVIATPSFSPFPGSTYGNNVAGAELGY